MAGSNERRNKAIMDKLIKDLKTIPEEFDNVVTKSLNGTVMVAEIYAKDLTPTITGEAREKWHFKRAYKVTNGFESKLYNNSEYIGYINNGHRMEPHFVPGDWIGDIFKYDPSLKRGVIMGAKTKYVKGEFMLEKATGKAEKHLLKKLEEGVTKAKKKYEK